MKKRVLFLCTGNSCRSQMAEGWLRHLARDRAEVFSAGTHPAGLNPLAVQVMDEIEIDISAQQSDLLDRYFDSVFDYVITVCDSARQACPVFPGEGQMIHWSFADPADAQGTAAERLPVFRRVRDEIGQRLLGFAAAERI
ncbi:MAG: arsenate reductase ArsC [Candidatus Latescibacteria bacterium]|nr:arsenate reductase ArsC [Candidatus Latescibacterota bacterium]